MLLRARMLLRGTAGRRGRWQPRPEDAGPAAPSAPPPPPADPATLLADLDRLREQGVLTDEEYARERTRILG